MIYFVYDSGAVQCFYRGRDGSIYQRRDDGGKWSKAVCAANDVRAQFFVMREDETGLICQDSGGDMLLCLDRDGVWQQNVILKSLGSVPDIFMTRTGDTIFYTIPQNGRYTLIMQKHRDGRWERSTMIDGCTPFAACPFRVLGLNNGITAVIYKKGKSVGLRVTDKSGEISGFEPLYTASGDIHDISLLAGENAVEAVLAVRGRFSARLVYVSTRSPDKPETLWEGAGADIAAAERDENGALNVTLACGNTVYGFTRGKHGSRVQRLNVRPKKAFVLGHKGMCDVLADGDRGYEIVRG